MPITRAVLLALLSLFAALHPTARAETYIWDGGGHNANWSTSENWSISATGKDPSKGVYPGVPGSGCNDTAFIPSGAKVQIDADLCLAFITIESGAKVVILENRVVSQASFGGAGMLTNRGIVLSSGRDHIVALGPDLIVKDRSTARWCALGPEATIEFHAPQCGARRLHGEFHVSIAPDIKGVIHAYANVETYGGFNGECGFNVICAAGVYFVWDYGTLVENYCLK